MKEMIKNVFLSITSTIPMLDFCVKSDTEIRLLIKTYLQEPLIYI